MLVFKLAFYLLILLLCGVAFAAREPEHICPGLEQELDQNHPIAQIFELYPEDPIFVEGFLPVKGPVIRYPRALQEISNVLARYPELMQKAHGALLFHGSRSASLLAFTDYGGKTGDLKPLGQLEIEGKVSFCGEIIYGRGGANLNSLSTVFISAIRAGVGYSGLRSRPRSAWERLIAIFSPNETGWIPERALALIGELQKGIDEHLYGPGSIMEITLRNAIEIHKKRVLEFPKLNPEEKRLVRRNFPVLYGLRIFRPGAQQLPSISTVTDEIMLYGGATVGEIRVIFVPKSEVKYVRGLLERNLGRKQGIAVEDISFLR